MEIQDFLLSDYNKAAKARLNKIIKAIQKEIKKPSDFKYSLSFNKEVSAENRESSSREVKVVDITIDFSIENKVHTLKCTFDNKEVDILELNDFINANDVPVSPLGNFKHVTVIEYKEFILAYKQAIKFASKDVKKKKLVNIHFDNGVIVATDSFQLYHYDFGSVLCDATFNLNKKQVEKITSYKDIVLIEIDFDKGSDKVLFTLVKKDSIKIQVAFNVTTDYVNYPCIMWNSENALTTVNFTVSTMISNLKTLKPSLSKETPLIKLVIDRQLVIECNNENSRAKHNIPCNSIQGLSQDVGLSNRYFEAMFKTFKAMKFKELNLYLINSESVVMLKEGKLTTILMPMDLD